MKILVANIGSTSFKFRLFEMPTEQELARGGVERIGQARSRCYFRHAGQADWDESQQPVANQGQALARCLQWLTSTEPPLLKGPSELAAVGFKAVIAKGLTGVHRVDKKVIEAMEAYAKIAPAHNPPYVKAIKALRRQFPELPLVAAFETGFHETIPPANRSYAVPRAWSQRYGIARLGFHGASHRYIAVRTAELLGRDDARIISCHLGGSSSVCAIRAGQSVANSFGFSPQSGLPHASRVGDFDPYALLALQKATGKSTRKLLDEMATEGGLRGISGLSGDLRDIQEAADKGNSDAQLAIDVFINAVRHCVGAYLVELAGAEAIIFTGGIGENSSRIRAGVCRDMGWCGLELDERRNEEVKGHEGLISTDASKIAVWVVPTNEEVVVARQCVELLGQQGLGP